MADAPEPAANPQTYDLRAAEGPKRLLVKLTVRGITISEHGLAWTGADGPREVGFTDIAGIHLGAGLIGQTTLDTCRIAFADGGGLVTADWVRMVCRTSSSCRSTAPSCAICTPA